MYIRLQCMSTVLCYSSLALLGLIYGCTTMCYSVDLQLLTHRPTSGSQGTYHHNLVSYRIQYWIPTVSAGGLVPYIFKGRQLAHGAVTQTLKRGCFQA